MLRTNSSEQKNPLDTSRLIVGYEPIRRVPDGPEGAIRSLFSLLLNHEAGCLYELPTDSSSKASGKR